MLRNLLLNKLNKDFGCYIITSILSLMLKISLIYLEKWTVSMPKSIIKKIMNLRCSKVNHSST